MIISKKRINSTKFIEKLPTNKFFIGIRVTNEEHKKLGIKEFEEWLTIEPSAMLGTNCKKNSVGYSFPDKTRAKENRYITTIEYNLLDWGGYEHSGYVDIYRDAYPRIEVAPTNVEFMCITDNLNRKFIIALIDDISNKSLIKISINMFLEIFGYCEIFNENMDLIVDKLSIKRCNWEILPKGIKLDYMTLKNKHNDKTKNKGFEEYRLKILNDFNPNEIFLGTGGFEGYFAFLFDKCCCLESSYYGNATYFLPIKDWEELSKLSKKDLLSSKSIIKKIIHNARWYDEVNNTMKNIHK